MQKQQPSLSCYTMLSSTMKILWRRPAFVAVIVVIVSIIVHLLSVMREYVLNITSDKEVTIELTVSADAPYVAYKQTGKQFNYTLHDINYWDLTVYSPDGKNRDKREYDLSVKQRNVYIHNYRIVDTPE